MSDVQVGESIVFLVTHRVAGLGGKESNHPVYSPRYAREVLTSRPWPKQLYVRGVVKGYTAWNGTGAATMSSTITPEWRNGGDESEFAGYTVEVSSAVSQMPNSMTAAQIVKLLGSATGSVTLDVPRKWVSVTRSVPKVPRPGGRLPNDVRPSIGQFESTYFLSPYSYARESDLTVGKVVAYRGRVCVVTSIVTAATGKTFGLVCATAPIVISATTPAQQTYTGVVANEVMVLPKFGACAATYAKDQAVAWVERLGGVCEFATVQAAWYTYEGDALVRRLQGNRAFDEPELRKVNPNYAALDMRLCDAAQLFGGSCRVQYTLKNIASGAVQDAFTPIATNVARSGVTAYGVAAGLVAPRPKLLCGDFLSAHQQEYRITTWDFRGFGHLFTGMCSMRSLSTKIIMRDALPSNTLVGRILLCETADYSDVNFSNLDDANMTARYMQLAKWDGHTDAVTHPSAKLTTTASGLKFRYVVVVGRTNMPLRDLNGHPITQTGFTHLLQSEGLTMPGTSTIAFGTIPAGGALLDENSDAWSSGGIYRYTVDYSNTRITGDSLVRRENAVILRDL
jgi:hypothetical protein